MVVLPVMKLYTSTTPATHSSVVGTPLEKASSVMPAGTACFEVEELYVRPSFRSRGVGAALFRFAEEAVRGEAAYMMVSTATKNWRAILHFYLEELGMDFWSARLFKKIEEGI